MLIFDLIIWVHPYIYIYIYLKAQSQDGQSRSFVCSKDRDFSPQRVVGSEMFLGRVKQWYCRSDGQQCQPRFFGKCWFTKKGTPLLAVCKLIWTYMKYHLFGGLSLYSIQINSMALNQLIRLWCTGRSFRGCLQKWWGLITWDHMGLTSKPAQQVRGEHDYELQICRS